MTPPRERSPVRRLGIAMVTAALGSAAAPAARAAEGFPTGVLIERVPVAAAPQESYALYLPSTYSPARPAPILYAFDPRARGGVPVERFRAAAERYGWTVVGSNASRNGIPVTDIVARLWDDTHQRLAIDERRVYLTGFSGGARVASGIGFSARGLVAGVLAFGAGLPAGGRVPGDATLAYFGGAGRDDFNLAEMRQLAGELDAASVANRFEVWEGGHEWCPPEVCACGLEWLELRAMRAGTRARDDALLEQWARRDEARAREQEAAGALVEAAVAFDLLARDFQGLRETGAYREAAARLRGSRAYEQALRARRDDERRQARLASELAEAIQQITGDTEARLSALTRLRASVHDLRRAAEKDGESREARVARRVLGGAWIQALEASSGLRAQKEYRRAAEALALAGEIRPLAAAQFYDLARLHALGGDDRQALQALTRAVEGGFRDADALQNEPDLARVRRRPEFAALLQRARAAPPSTGEK